MNQTNHQHQSNNKTAVFSNNNANPADIQQHLQSIFNLLRPEDTLKMAVRLESVHPGRIRYLVVITCQSDSKPGVEESCLLGIDCKQKNETTMGLVLAILADTKITLDGDGGFSILVGARYHIFKPISVQAMWSSLQTLHRAADEARSFNFYAEGSTHIWTSYYSDSILSDRSCLNEWNALDGLTSKRPPSPDLCTESRDQTRTKELIRSKLKEIMTYVLLRRCKKPRYPGLRTTIAFLGNFAMLIRSCSRLPSFSFAFIALSLRPVKVMFGLQGCLSLHADLLQLHGGGHLHPRHLPGPGVGRAPRSCGAIPGAARGIDPVPPACGVSR